MIASVAADDNNFLASLTIGPVQGREGAWFVTHFRSFCYGDQLHSERSPSGWQSG